MPIDPSTKNIYHITDISNLAGILASGGIFSDAAMRNAATGPTEIGYAIIKERRLTEYRVQCCDDRFVGEFVPFYFCPRSPMLSTINKGNTGRPPGCQETILHLVSTVANGYNLNKQWTISDGNAGSAYTTFANDLQALDRVNWEIVESWNWAGERLHVKATEFLIADFFPVSALIGIGCHNEETAVKVRAILVQHNSRLKVKVFPKWYY
jgi:hypothetical protein